MFVKYDSLTVKYNLCNPRLWSSGGRLLYDKYQWAILQKQLGHFHGKEDLAKKLKFHEEPL